MYTVVSAYHYITDYNTRRKPTSPMKMPNHTEPLFVINMSCIFNNFVIQEYTNIKTFVKILHYASSIMIAH